jgi:hypothetical protein
MGTAVAIACGAAGGLVGWVVIFAMPEIRLLLKQKKLIRPGRDRVVLMLLLALSFVVVGGAAAVVLGPADPKEAIMYGIAAEGLLAGLVKTAA